MRKPILLGMIFCSLLLLSPIRARAYLFSDGEWHSTTFNTDSQYLTPLAEADLDGNGIPEKIILNNDRAFIETNGENVWENPSGWKVIQAQIGDLNHDDKPELILLIRRAFRPWPVDKWLPYGGRIDDFQDSSGMGCHIILIGWQGERYKEIWAGSSMAQPALAIGAADFDQDGQVELVTMEGIYDDKSTYPGKAIKLWEWNGFGFSLLTSLPGNYNNFMIFTSQSKQNPISIITY